MAGRPKLSDEEKARRAKERERAKAAGIVPITARAPRRGVLRLIIDAANELAIVSRNASITAFGADEAGEINETLTALNDAESAVKSILGDLEPIAERIQREHELLIANDQMAARIAELEAQLADSQEQLRVTGNGERIPLKPIPPLKLKSKKNEPEPAHAA